MFRVLFFILLISTLPASAARLESLQFNLDGHTRSYLKYAPETARDGTPRPLIIVLHGAGGSARGLRRITNRRFEQLADRDGAIVVYPNALDKVWDLGEGPISNGLTRRVNDLRFFQTVIAQISAEHNVDVNRLFATGMSRGGQASYLLACKLPGRFRAIAPVVMPLPIYFEDDCQDIPPTGLMVINGTADPVVPYNGGAVITRNRTRGQLLSTDQTMVLWRQRNGCSSAGAVQTIGRVDRIDGVGCTAPAVLLRVNGGGHTWPGGRQYLPRFLVGPTNRDINATDEIWAFFRRYF